VTLQLAIPRFFSAIYYNTLNLQSISQRPQKALQIVTVKARSFLSKGMKIKAIKSILYINLNRGGTEDAIEHQQRENLNTFFKGGIQPCLNLKKHSTD
jgi:hypothetical protein